MIRCVGSIGSLRTENDLWQQHEYLFGQLGVYSWTAAGLLLEQLELMWTYAFTWLALSGREANILKFDFFWCSQIFLVKQQSQNVGFFAQKPILATKLCVSEFLMQDMFLVGSVMSWKPRLKSEQWTDWASWAQSSALGAAYARNSSSPKNVQHTVYLLKLQRNVQKCIFNSLFHQHTVDNNWSWCNVNGTSMRPKQSQGSSPSADLYLIFATQTIWKRWWSPLQHCLTVDWGTELSLVPVTKKNSQQGLHRLTFVCTILAKPYSRRNEYSLQNQCPKLFSWCLSS